MSKKKLLLTAVALVMVCVVSVVGTVAYLTKTSNGDEGGITNTFIPAGPDVIEDYPEDQGGAKKDFSIVETPVKQNDDGTYVKDPSASAKVGSGITYEILPGQTLPKDTTVHIVGKNDVPVYLYVEVKESMTANTYTYSIDTTKWVKLSVTGKNGGDVYAYTGEDVSKKVPVIVKSATGLTDYDIPVLTGDTVAVSSTADISKITEDSISFYGYMAQASAGTDAASAFTACGFAAAAD